jgi:hypothetical protein
MCDVAVAGAIGLAFQKVVPQRRLLLPPKLESEPGIRQPSAGCLVRSFHGLVPRLTRSPGGTQGVLTLRSADGTQGPSSYILSYSY